MARAVIRPGLGSARREESEPGGKGETPPGRGGKGGTAEQRTDSIEIAKM